MMSTRRGFGIGVLLLAAMLFAMVTAGGCLRSGGAPGPAGAQEGEGSPEVELRRNVLFFEQNATLLASRIHELINDERRAAGLAELEWDPRLAEIALAHSRDMAARDYFGHVDPEGNDFADRYSKAGYTHRTELSDRTLLGGENLFKYNVVKSYAFDEVSGEVSEYSFNTLEEMARATVEGWMGSTGHRENILTPFSREGIGVCVDADGEVYITENFS